MRHPYTRNAKAVRFNLPTVLITACTLFTASLAAAQQAPGTTGFGGAVGSTPDPVRWELKLQPQDLRKGEIGELLATAHITQGWHIYSSSQAAGGPIATSLKLKANSGLAEVGPILEPTPIKLKAVGFTSPVLEFTHSVTFGIPVRSVPGVESLHPQITVSYEPCNDRFCLPPKTISLQTAGAPGSGPPRQGFLSSPHSPPAQPAPEAAVPGKAVPGKAVAGRVAAALPAGSHNIAERIKRAQNGGIWSFLLLAFLSGFLALATPCVFPMIPITVSLFTKQEGSEQGSNLTGAVTYCLGIVGTFTGLGLLLAAAFGASGIARFAANPWVNVGIAAVFTGLALALMGFLDLAVPPSIVDAAHRLSGRGGIFGTLLMGLTFTLTSFTCTVPYVGTLLVATAQGSWLWPALGMLAFSSAFALPFFVLALFPRFLVRLPRSGSWLSAVKAFMGFIELAAAVKFLSNADLVWQGHVLTRTVFLMIWALIGIAAGLYLFGWLRLAHTDGSKIGAVRRCLGVAVIAAGLYSAAASAGAPLGPVDAYVPPVGYGFRRQESKLVVGGDWLRDYDQALALARASNKPLFVDFTGYTCTNCRWMEANIFPNPAVRQELSQLVLVQLYTDGTDARSDANRNQEQHTFNTIALPLYAVVAPNGQAIDAFPGLTHSPTEFASFLRKAREQAMSAGA